ncbi:unnamed protein product [Sphenostylis stenocarpa]|uniref:Uncharacterized protein n=1 Tax=Sphenostylis stenocarpa TaxID=92480 RepID=A0AA86T9J6_9FABA|nr:unnamed protein product [Sphenostylis stenocarpa]
MALEEEVKVVVESGSSMVSVEEVKVEAVVEVENDNSMALVGEVKVVEESDNSMASFWEVVVVVEESDNNMASLVEEVVKNSGMEERQVVEVTSRCSGQLRFEMGSLETQLPIQD